MEWWEIFLIVIASLVVLLVGTYIILRYKKENRTLIKSLLTQTLICNHKSKRYLLFTELNRGLVTPSENSSMSSFENVAFDK